ncbi:DUF502 domain-containing protein [Lignipirellula cremea]|uniref:DUF502 domain-containing protein n=1 Tax=Lignipirellula cremea TaxID=2528010 RepID=A0A518DYK3_9BACT|nr:DUF502 domain-containing protein [Lignipirellula cremea]QDU96875.1 hypothetical protein Pla8534_46970 [Lignipirellula cremea]
MTDLPTQADPPPTEPEAPTSASFPFFHSVFRFIRMRVVQGLFLALPVAITFWILHWLYRMLRDVLIDPMAVVVRWLSLQIWYDPTKLDQAAEQAAELPAWFDYYAAPLIALVFILGLLYFFGMFFQSRLHRLLDWILLRVPVVTHIYSAVRKVFVALQEQQTNSSRFQRVVLVTFPHTGMKAPGFVTSTCRDRLTGKKILCVYVPTTPVPTSGYMLLVPEEEVSDLSWDLNETLQAIVSGGISVPKDVDYYGTEAEARLAQTDVRSPPGPEAR